MRAVSRRRAAWPVPRFRRAAVLLCVTTGLVLAIAPALDAQSRSDPRLENRMLRQASAREGQGDLAGAEATLRELLRLQPSSSAAVFALERVYRSDGRVVAVLPVVDAYLVVEPEVASVWALKVAVLAETDSVSALEGAVREWIVAVPGSPDPYREGAVAYLEAFGAGKAAELIEEGLGVLGDREARGFLNGFARKAEDLARPWSALWAYEQLRDMADDPAEARSTDERLAGAAMAAGDTTTALAARRRITESYVAGSAERRSSWTEELRIQVAAEDAEASMEALAAFRDEFPDATELDGLSAALASRLLGRGMREAAMEVLSGIEGPRAALERAFLLLEGGAFPEGIAALQASLPDLEPADATEMIELSLALSELTSVGARLAAHVAIAGHRGHPEDGVQAVAAGIDAVPASDRPAILALGARAADAAALADLATAFRRRLVAEHPDAREFPDAAVRLARAVAARPGGRDEAVRILEALIVGRPDNPIVPGARQELRRIQAGGPGERGEPGAGGRAQ